MKRIALASIAAVSVLAAALSFLSAPSPELDGAGGQMEGAPAAWSAEPLESVSVETYNELADLEILPDEAAAGLEPDPFEQEATDVGLLEVQVEPQPVSSFYSAPADKLALQLAEPLRADRTAEPLPKPTAKPAKFAEGHASKSLRNTDFPRTYISAIHVDLTSPNHWVELTWSGPQAARQETGPFRSSPGAGLGHNDCDDMDECNRNGSNCTPKGTHAVEAFSDYLPSVPACRHVTWFMVSREIAFHSHRQVPRYPASHGCVRLDAHAAQLIHNNSLIGETEVSVDGTWTGAELVAREPRSVTNVDVRNLRQNKDKFFGRGKSASTLVV